MESDSENIYSTRDLSEASMLLVKNQKLLKLNREGNIVYFMFDDKLACEKLSGEFFFGECLVNAKSYYEAILTLKNRIFSK